MPLEKELEMLENDTFTILHTPRVFCLSSSPPNSIYIIIERANYFNRFLFGIDQTRFHF